MKTVFRLWVCAVTLALAVAAHAGLSLQLDLIHSGNIYTLAPGLSTTTNGGDSTPVTYDQIYSPQTNFTGGVGAGSQNNRDSYTDFNAFVQAVTNGIWTLVVNVGDPSQNTYTFTVSSILTSNAFAGTVITYPEDGATVGVSLPDFTWQGPTNADYLYVYTYNSEFTGFQFAFPSLSATNTTVPPALTNGNYTVVVDYQDDISALLVATTPKDGSGNTPPGWASTALFDDGSQVGFTVDYVPPASTASGHTNIAYYTFDNSGDLGADSSGNSNDLNGYYFWASNLFSFSTDAEAGGGAVQFIDTSALGVFDQTFQVWTNTFAGSFSVSLWLNTTTVVGNDSDDLNDYDGQSIIYSDNYGSGGASPVGLTGSKVAFLTTDTTGVSDTLHSQTSVTTGSYVHIVSTRDATSGQKCIYVNGQLDNSNYASLENLTGETYATIGGNTGTGYTGLVDDVQIYSGVLLASDVSNLYANPGTSLPNVIGGPPLVVPVGHTNIAHYAFDNSAELGLDSSTNHNDLNGGSYWGTTNFIFNTNAEAGAGAVQFFGDSDLNAVSQAMTAWLNAFSGSFSVSVWINTTNTAGNDSDNLSGYSGQSVIYDENDDRQGQIPVGLTGSKVAFLTTDASNNADTLHSRQSVTTGRYTHIVTTLNQATGQKSIYINGQLDNFDAASLPLLSGETETTIGGGIGASGYVGLVDDVQIYTGVLLASDVSNLYASPGTVIPDAVGGNTSPMALGEALNAPELSWTNSGDALWFAETSVSLDGAAAQSGSLTDFQASYLQSAVTGPGTLTFYWQTMAGDDIFDLEFDMDDNYQADIYGDTPWQQYEISIPSGTHSLTWLADAYDGSGSSPTDAGWVDQVIFTYDAPLPVTITSPALVGTNFQFSFVSQVNHTDYVQYSTNLASTNWFPLATVPGDGFTKTLTVPVNAVPEYFRVETQ